MATITGTQGEKTDQLTQLFLAQQAQIRLMQWLGGILLPLLIAFVAWLVLSVNSTKLEIVGLQGEMKLLNRQLEQLEKTLEKMDAKLGKIEERLDKLEKQKAE
jgi:hypothetical protein